MTEGDYSSWSWEGRPGPNYMYNRQRVKLVQSPANDDQAHLTVTDHIASVTLSSQQFEALREIMKAYEETQ